MVSPGTKPSPAEREEPLDEDAWQDPQPGEDEPDIEGDLWWDMLRNSL